MPDPSGVAAARIPAEDGGDCGRLLVVGGDAADAAAGVVNTAGNVPDGGRAGAAPTAGIVVDGVFTAGIVVDGVFTAGIVVDGVFTAGIVVDGVLTVGAEGRATGAACAGTLVESTTLGGNVVAVVEPGTVRADTGGNDGFGWTGGPLIDGGGTDSST